MEVTQIKIKKVNPEAKVPIYATPESAGFDFYSLDNYIIEPGKVKKVPTGIALEMPAGSFLLVVSRSGLASKGIYHMCGTIDSDYRGEIHLLMLNTTDKPFQIEKGDRIAQGIFLPVFKAEFKESINLGETQRGSGGFHSTGRK